MAGQARRMISGGIVGVALLALPFSLLVWVVSVNAVARALAQRQEAAPRRVRIYLAAAFALLLGSWVAAAVVYRAIRWPLWWSLPLAAHALHLAAVVRLLQRRVSSPKRENTTRS